MVLLKLALGEIRGVRVEDIHRFEIQGTDTAHEGLFEIFLHHSFHLVALADLICCIVEALPQHLDLFTVVSTDALDLMFHSFFEVLGFLLLSIGQMRLDPTLPEGAHLLFLMTGQFVLDHLS